MGAWLSCPETFLHDAWRELRGHPFRDDPFYEEDWQAHGTWRRYIPEPSVSGIVILTLAPMWGWSVVVSAALGLYATNAEPAGWPNVSQHESFLTVFTLTSFALSLLMLFKTTSSYSRWWEARMLWGSGYITVRSILRLSISFVGRRHPDLLPAIFRFTSAILPALAAHLRGRNHYLEEHLRRVLHPAELQWLMARGHGRGIPPIAVLQVLSRLLDRAVLDVMERQQIEALLSQCDIVVGGCERIKSQPIPYAWNRHTHRFLLFYITFLPFAFWPLFEWATLPVMAMLSFLLCGVENVGVQIEEPHRILPLNHICAGTLRALRLMMEGQQAATDMAAFAAGFGATHWPADLAVEMAPPIQHMEVKDCLSAPQSPNSPSSSDSGDSCGCCSGDEPLQQAMHVGRRWEPSGRSQRRSTRGSRRTSNDVAAAAAVPTPAGSGVELTLPSGSSVVVETPTIRDASS